MEDRLAALERRIAEVADRLAGIESRLEAVEVGAASPATAEAREAGVETPDAATAPPFAASDTATGTLSLVGRTFLVLAGAFLLRWATEGGLLPGGVGVALGLGYAIVLVVLSDRAAAGTLEASAWAHGGAAMVIGLPLVYEATVRFKVLSAEMAAATLVGLAGAALVVAARRSLSPVAWFATLGTLATTVALLLATHRITPLCVVLLLLGLATTWLRCDPRWRGLRWFAAACADLIVLQAVELAVLPDRIPEAYQGLSPGAVELLAAILAVAYIGTFVFQTLAGWAEPGPFEVAQTAAVLLVGVWGAVRIATRMDSGVAVYGIVCTVLAGVGFAVALRIYQRSAHSRRTASYLASVAVALTLIGSSLLLSGAALAVLWATCGVLVAALVRRIRLQAVRVFAATFLLAAAMGSALGARVWEAFAAPALELWTPVTPGAAFVIAAALACYALLRASTREDGSWQARGVQLVVALLALAGCGAVLLVTMVPAVGEATRAPFAAAARTVVLCAAALLLAALGRNDAQRELSWPVYPIIVLTGLKMLLEDLPRGGAASLFVAFVAFGGTLIVGPRLLRRG